MLFQVEVENPGFSHILAVMAEVHARAGDIFTEVGIVVVEDGSCRGDQVMAMIQCGGPNSDDGGRMMLGAMLMVIGDGSGDNVDSDYIKIW